LGRLRLSAISTHHANHFGARPWAKALKRDVMTLWFAIKHAQTPRHMRGFGKAKPSL
jgi:hypothetical protein